MGTEENGDFMNQPEAEVKTDTNDKISAKNDEIEQSATENEHFATDNVQKAIDKLRKEKASATNKDFADPILGYIEERVKESPALAGEVLQNHKTWNNCYQYIFSQAKKNAKGKNSAAFTNETVFEWAEDYFHKDDSKEAEQKAKQEEANKKRAEAAKQKAAKPAAQKPVKDPVKAEKAEAVKQTSKEEKPAEEAISASQPKKAEKKKKTTDMDGQMDLFSMFGMEG